MCTCAGIKDGKKRALLTRLAAEFSVSAQRAEPSRIEVLQAPKVLKRPYTVLGANGERREDPYYWLRDDERENPEVLEHLKAGFKASGPINLFCCAYPRLMTMSTMLQGPRQQALTCLAGRSNADASHAET